MPAGLDAMALDPSVKPCDDFYQFACGGWLKATPIPPDRSRWGRGFNTIQERNEQILKEMLEATAEGKPPAGTPYARQLGDYYATCMDESKLESAVPELRTALRRIDRVATSREIATELARLHQAGSRALFVYDSGQDYKDATQVIGIVDQGGLGLPDRDYYLSDTPKMKEIRDGYRAYVAQMFGLLGDAPAVAAKKADQVMSLETKLAKASLDRVSRRDPNKIYHRTDPKALVRAAPGFDWATYFRSVGTPGVQALNVTYPPFATEVGQLVRSAPRAELRTYLGWRLRLGTDHRPAEAVRRRVVRLQQQVPHRREGGPAPLEEVRDRHRPGAGGGAGRPVRRADLRRRREAGDEVDGEGDPARLPGGSGHARLDGSHAPRPARWPSRRRSSTRSATRTSGRPTTAW